MFVNSPTGSISIIAVVIAIVILTTRTIVVIILVSPMTISLFIHIISQPLNPKP